MGRLDRYIFSTAAVAFAGVVIVLAGMIWSTQALRQLDLVTSQGQTILAFVAITSLTMPTLVLVIAPAALFIATAYTLLKLNGDSEIVVMAAAGMNPWRVLRALILLALLVSAFCAALAISVVPTSLRAFRDQVTKVRADVVSFVAQPGRFITLTPGLVFHVRERAANGVMRGIFIHDARDKEITTYLADRGQIVDSDAGTFLVLENGSIHRRGGEKNNSTSVVEFQRYALDLSSLAPNNQGQDVRPAERPLAYVLNPPANDVYQLTQPGRFREELHKRLSAGLYPLAYFAIAAAALARPRTTRQSRGAALVAIIPAMAVVQIGNFAIAGQLRTQDMAVPLIYLFPLVVVILCALTLSDRIHLAPPRALSARAEELRQRLSGGKAA
ncbi:LPS export ABC transporter permease LptF [Xanthobacter agilis]|uniref:Lipopolysaccharide export system permease protein n=1 Tax=Xanthobacter agilis TaxID=47492 RepID=A0ABU0LEV1_XANAG|nr:LPS export ABC transporter permease LptF [Xanthobacter agilis]MDQ0505676.1 lipopolysaccharide export system permease protein [Xanthobacter agilis]